MARFATTEEIYQKLNISMAPAQRTIQTYHLNGRKKHRKIRVEGWVVCDHLFVHKSIVCEGDSWKWETWDITHWRSGMRLCSCSSWESAMNVARDIALAKYPIMSVRSLRKFREVPVDERREFGYFLLRMMRMHGETKYPLCCGIEEAEEKRNCNAPIHCHNYRWHYSNRRLAGLSMAESKRRALASWEAGELPFTAFSAHDQMAARTDEIPY